MPVFQILSEIFQVRFEDAVAESELDHFCVGPNWFNSMRLNHCCNTLTNWLILFPEFDLTFKGSDAIERRGAFYAISDGADHPVTKLMQAPKKVPKGSSVLVGLNIQKVAESYKGIFVFLSNQTETKY